MTQKLVFGIIFCGFHMLFSQEVTPKRIDTLTIVNKNISADNLVKFSKENLSENIGQNLSEVLSKAAGITLRQAGATVAKPVIEGLGNTRILILNNGVKLESQDWSDDHAPEIGMGIPQNISIIKGAQSVRYGAGALGGVVLLSPKKLNYSEKLAGAVMLSGNSNSGKVSGGGYIEGALGKNWAWRAQANAQYAGDYKTQNYYVNNTGIRELNYSAELEYRKNEFKSNLYFSAYNSELGIFYGAASSNIDDFESRLKLGRPITTYGFSYDITAPKHNVAHYFLKSETEFRLSPNNHFDLVYAYQNNHRKEFDVRRLDRTTIPTQNTKLDSHFVETIWKNTHFRGLETQFGVSYLRKENFNVPGTGVVPTIPNFVLNNYAGFFISEFKRGKWLAELGARFDFRTINSLGYDMFGQLYGGKRDFSSFSYSGGVHYQITDHLEYVAHAGYAWRAPEPYELYINGKQHGIPIYYVGDKNLNAEKGLKIVNKLSYKKNRFFAEMSAFVQPINNFIYSIPTHQYRVLFSGPAALFEFVQSDALFRGGDLAVGIPISKNLEYHSNLSLVYADDQHTKAYLPQIPPLQLSQSLKWNIPTSVFKNFYAKVEHQYFAKQRRFNPDFDLVADSPDAYHLLGLKIGAELEYSNKKSVKFFLGVENLTNALYKNYTDRLRYFIHGKGIDIQFKTQFNF